MESRFFSWLETRLAEYAVNRDRALKAHATRWANVAAKRNNGDLPTISERNGEYRFHAPYDGYIHVWCKGNSEYESEYLGGQFLPYDSPNEPMFGGSITDNLVIFDVPADRADKFCEEWKERGIDGKVISLRFSRPYTKKNVDGEYKVINVSHCPEDIRSAIDNYVMGDIYKLRQLEEKASEDEKSLRDEAHANGDDVPQGRQVITGEILAQKMQDSLYGETLKMLVQDDRGFRVWGTVPSSLRAVRGDRVTFTATIQQSEKDAKFGFFKRPSKAANITGEVAA